MNFWWFNKEGMWLVFIEIEESGGNVKLLENLFDCNYNTLNFCNWMEEQIFNRGSSLEQI